MPICCCPIWIAARKHFWSKNRVDGADFAETFGYLAMHTPFGGMVKGAHRDMMRKLVKAKPKEIEADFERRVIPGLTYCQRVGNIMGATTMLSLSTIDHGDFRTPQRVGCSSPTAQVVVPSS